jgi:hypothetical protein
MEQKFKDILDNPEAADFSQIEYLEKLTEEYPYFQVAHLLLAKKLYQSGKTLEFNNYLKKAAIYATDRKKLYHLIHTTEKVIQQQPITQKKEIPLSESIKEESKTLNAQEILSQRLEEISAKKKVNNQANENKESEPGVEKKNIEEKKDIKYGYFSVEELLELPEETKEITTPKVEDSVSKDVPKSSKLSFKDWLHYYSEGKKENSNNVNSPEEEKPKPQDLIDKFIKEEPRISPVKNNFFSPVNMARKSVIEQDDLVSETLANIYYAQGNLPKALHMYEKLSLKYPEKSAFFASQIEKIQNSLKSN